MFKNPKVIALIVLALIIGFFAGMEYKAYQVRKAISDVFNSPSNTQSANTNSPSNTEPSSLAEALTRKDYSVIEHKVGDEVELATVKFKVNKVQETQTLTGGFGAPVVAKQGTKFVIIDTSITNTGNTKFTFIADDSFKILDQKSREFSSYPNTIGNVNNYLDVRELSPSITENGMIVYELPSDATSYSIVVAKGGTNEIHKVILAP